MTDKLNNRLIAIESEYRELCEARHALQARGAALRTDLHQAESRRAGAIEAARAGAISEDVAGVRAGVAAADIHEIQLAIKENTEALAIAQDAQNGAAVVMADERRRMEHTARAAQIRELDAQLSQVEADLLRLVVLRFELGRAHGDGVSLQCHWQPSMDLRRLIGQRILPQVSPR